MELDDDTAKRIPEHLLGMDDMVLAPGTPQAPLAGRGHECVRGVWLLWEGGGPWPVAVDVGVIEHWSREVMRKYEKDTGAIPDWVTAVNLIANVAAAGLLLTGFILAR